VYAKSNDELIIDIAILNLFFSIMGSGNLGPLIGKLSYNDKLCMQTLCERGLGAKTSFLVALTKGGS